MDDWTVFHFSQSNPRGEGQDDVPALLRRVADTLASKGEVEVMDVTFSSDVTTDGDWPSITVYYSRPGTDDVPADIANPS